VVLIVLEEGRGNSASLGCIEATVPLRGEPCLRERNRVVLPLLHGPTRSILFPLDDERSFLSRRTA